MKKCTVCAMVSWVVGLSAIAWGIYACLSHIFSRQLHFLLENSFLSYDHMVLVISAISIGAALFGIGFLIYQPPFKPCPRCEKLTIDNLKKQTIIK